MGDPFALPPFFYGSHQRRLASYIVDRGLILLAQICGMVFGGMLAAAMAKTNLQPGLAATQKAIQSASSVGMMFGWLFWGSVAWFLNYGILQGITGSTLGKKLFSLRVINRNGSPLGILKSMGRTIAYFVSLAPMGVGILAYFWSDRAQCWHDSICDTLVLKVDSAELVQVPQEKEPDLFDLAA